MIKSMEKEKPIISTRDTNLSQSPSKSSQRRKRSQSTKRQGDTFIAEKTPSKEDLAKTLPLQLKDKPRMITQTSENDNATKVMNNDRSLLESYHEDSQMTLMADG